MSEPILKLSNISKRFPGVVALDKVNFSVMPGEIHVLVGENGAGKSTLIKIISGVYKKDEGTYELEGHVIDLKSPVQAKTMGISTVYQELTLAPHLSVAENIFMGVLPKKGLSIDWKKMYADSKALLDSLDMDIDPQEKVENLSVGFRQMVEIARALSNKSKVIIFDEPTAVLTEKETQVLFKNILKLKASGVGIIYISHRVAEILNFGDKITILRDGKSIGTVDCKNISYDDIVKMMVGRDVQSGFELRKVDPNPYISVEQFTDKNRVKEVSFHVHKGEILGVYGLVGSGRTEVVRMMFGLDKKAGGTLKIDGKEVSIKNPKEAIANGFGFLPEDRRRDGLVLELDVSKNICMASHKEISNCYVLSGSKEKNMAENGMKSISIKASSRHQCVMDLSGGNQQKCIIARWIAKFPDLKFLILDEPTRGVDVGAKAEIHTLIRDLADQGLTVLMVSSDMTEVLTVSDRIIVMREGYVAGEFQREDASEEKIIFCATK